MVSDTQSKLIIRADADPKTGSGHLMRCLALAQGWRAAGGEVVFVTNCKTLTLNERLRVESCQIVEISRSYPQNDDWLVLREVLQEFRESWCVVDGYNFDEEYYSLIRENGNQLLVIDDLAHLDLYDVDIILNQNIHAASLHYNCSPDSLRLFGPRYAMLRREFSAWRRFERKVPTTAKKILITMGGGDLHNQTMKAIRSVQTSHIEGLQIKAIAGENNPHFSEIETSIQDSPVSIELLKSTESMSESMYWADIAISASGSTCWELAYMQVPSILIITAENQIDIAAGLEKAEFARNMGWYEDVSEEGVASELTALVLDKDARARMSKRGRFLVDGNGIYRIVEELKRRN